MGQTGFTLIEILIVALDAASWLPEEAFTGEDSAEETSVELAESFSSESPDCKTPLPANAEEK